MSERVDLTELIDYMKTVESIYAMSDAVRGELVLALRVLRVLRHPDFIHIGIIKHNYQNLSSAQTLDEAERIFGYTNGGAE